MVSDLCRRGMLASAQLVGFTAERSQPEAHASLRCVLCEIREICVRQNHSREAITPEARSTDNRQQTTDIEVKRVEKGKMAGQQTCY